MGTEILFQTFGADRVDAFDLDPHMVRLARRRLARYGDRVQLWSGDVTAIEASAETYDAVFDFGIVHHVPAWRDALREIHRVLAPGGRLYAEEVLDRFILHPVWRRLLDHPLEDRFDHAGFIAGLEGAGLHVVAEQAMGPWFGWYVGVRTEG